MHQVMASGLEVEETLEAGAMTQIAWEGVQFPAQMALWLSQLRVNLPTITPGRVVGKMIFMSCTT